MKLFYASKLAISRSRAWGEISEGRRRGNIHIYRAGTSYRSNGPKCEEFQHGCGCRTRKRRRLAARRERDRDPPCRSRRRNRSGVRNCPRWPRRPRSPAPRGGSPRRLRGIGASMPFSDERSTARENRKIFFSTFPPAARLISPAMHAPNFSHGDITLTCSINFSTDSSPLYRRNSRPRTPPRTPLRASPFHFTVTRVRSSGENRFESFAC